MNIKGVNISAVLPVDPKPKVEGKARMQGTTDRDGNGRREQPEPEQKRHLNDQEFDEAIKALEAVPGLKSNNLKVRVEIKDDCRVILIVDAQDNVVRRLTEQQLWTTTRDKDRATGKFLDKAM